MPKKQPHSVQQVVTAQPAAVLTDDEVATLSQPEARPEFALDREARTQIVDEERFRHLVREYLASLDSRRSPWEKLKKGAPGAALEGLRWVAATTITALLLPHLVDLVSKNNLRAERMETTQKEQGRLRLEVEERLKQLEQSVPSSAAANRASLSRFLTARHNFATSSESLFKEYEGASFQSVARDLLLAGAQLTERPLAASDAKAATPAEPSMLVTLRTLSNHEQAVSAAAEAWSMAPEEASRLAQASQSVQTLVNYARRELLK